MDQSKTFWQWFWEIAKRPTLYFKGSPLAQSAAATGLNLWLLVLAVLGQFWVILSALLLLAQTYNTWLVARGQMQPWHALLAGAGIVLINFFALVLAVLAQFWVFGSLVLSVWQYWNLIQVCRDRWSKKTSMS